MPKARHATHSGELAQRSTALMDIANLAIDPLEPAVEASLVTTLSIRYSCKTELEANITAGNECTLRTVMDATGHVSVEALLLVLQDGLVLES